MEEISNRPAGLRPPYPRVGVVIVTWNRRSYVLRLLDTLRANPYPNWSVLVVDNASTDGSADAIRSAHPWVRCIANPVNAGGSGGFNTGLNHFLNEGGYDYLWLLDNDVEIEPGALEVLVEALESHRDAAVAGSHMIQLDYKNVTNEIGGDCRLDKGRLDLRWHASFPWMHRNEVYEVDYVAACSMLVRFDMMKRIGCMDDFFIHFDDVDWCLRFREAGYKTIACAASRIKHLSGRSKRVTWILYYDVRNMLFLQLRHGDLGRWYFVKAFLKAAARSFRDELSGKRYYVQLCELGWRDFLCRKMGRRADLPSLKSTPVAAVLDRILREKNRRVFTMEPLCRPFITEDNLAAARSNGNDLVAICHEAGIGARQLPDGVRLILLPSGRARRAWALLKMAVAGPRPDYLVLDIDRLCGFLGLLSSRIILLVDDGCIELPGGWMRLFHASVRIWRWVAMVPHLLLFVLSGRGKKNADPTGTCSRT